MSLLLRVVNVENPNFGIYTRAYLNALAIVCHAGVVGAFFRYFVKYGAAYLIPHYRGPKSPILKYAFNILPFVPAMLEAAKIKFDGSELLPAQSEPIKFAASWAQRSVSVAAVGLSAALGGYGVNRLAAINHSLVLGVYTLAYPCRLLLATIDPRYELGGLTSKIEWMATFLDRHIFTLWRKRIKTQRFALSRSSLGPDFDAPKFRYKPLRSNTTIRLLRMQTDGDKSWAFSCDLVEVELEAAPPYAAASYVWGSKIPVYHLLIHGQDRGKIAITANARAVLESIIPLDGLQYIWIDSICIDQGNEDEKNSQISRMAQIYRNAKFVLAFLRDEPDADEAITFIQKTSFESLKRQHNPLEVKDFYWARRAMIEEHPLNLDDPGWLALENMALNMYWTRAWIVQECMMARNIRLVYGGRYCDWFWFSVLLDTLGGPAWAAKRKRLYPPPLVAHIGLISLKKTLFHEQEKPRLGELIFQFGLARASDPSDQVYAFLSMSRDATEQSLQPRKGQTPEQVYTNLVRYELSQGRFTFLAMAGLSHARTKSNLTSLPSWAPDLTCASVAMPMAVDPNPWLVATSDPSLSCRFKISENGSNLGLAATCIDAIQHCSSDPDPQHFSHITLDQSATAYDFIVGPLIRLAQMRRLAAASHGVKRYGTDAWPEAFWRTLIQNFDGSNIPSQIDFGEIVQMLALQGESWQTLDTDQSDRQWRQVKYDEVRSLHRREFESPSESELKQQALAGKIFMAIRHKTFAVSELGYWSMVPPGTRPGDVIALVQGMPSAVILRPTGGADGSFALWGTAYTYGLEIETARKDWDWLVLR